MQAVPKSLARLVIHSQQLGLMKAGPEVIAQSTRFADLARDVLTDARRRGELVRSADPEELGEILGALDDGRHRGLGVGALAQVAHRSAALPVRPGGRPVPVDLNFPTADEHDSEHVFRIGWEW